MRIGPIPRAWKRSARSWTEFEPFRVLLIVTFRPEFDRALGWTTLCDEPRAQSAGEREIGGHDRRVVVGNKYTPGERQADIIERTDGIPLFVEEMTKAVLEAEAKAKRSAPLPRFRPRPWRSPQACTPR